MSEPLTPERRAELRRDWLAPLGDNYSVCLHRRELTALLDAADERDRLAAQVERVRALHVIDSSGYCVECDDRVLHPPRAGRGRR